MAANWRTAGLDAPTLALLEHTAKLTLTPTACGPADVETLRAVGLTDAAISEATQVIAYFNYINRIAEGLGIEMEDWLDALGREL